MGPITKNQGYATFISAVFVAIMLVAATGFLTFISNSRRQAHVAADVLGARYAAEAGLEKAVWYLNQDSDYDGEIDTIFGEGEFDIVITDVDGNTKKIEAAGEVNGVARTVKATVEIDDNVIAFNYGVQAGNGGFSLSGGSSINGSVYSNCNVVATNGVTITGSAIAANPASLTADQVNDQPSTIGPCTSSTCITFGNSSSTQDFAQSFRVSDALPLNNVQFYIKKVSTPGNETVRIVNDNSGSPGTTTLMTSTFTASSVTTNFAWVTVTLPSTPVLDPSQTYWIVIDGSNNGSRYYIIGANSNGYADGTAKLGQYGGSWSGTS